MKYYYLLVFVFFFAKVFAQNNEDAESYATGTDTADSEEALNKKIITLQQFCEFNLNETDVNVKAFNLQICQTFAQLNAGDTDGATQTFHEIFANNNVQPEKKREIFQTNVQLMKQIQESVHASYYNE